MKKMWYVRIIIGKAKSRSYRIMKRIEKKLYGIILKISEYHD